MKSGQVGTRYSFVGTMKSGQVGTRYSFVGTMKKELFSILKLRSSLRASTPLEEKLLHALTFSTISVVSLATVACQEISQKPGIISKKNLELFFKMLFFISKIK
jgi:hypothetical protein